MLGLLFIIMSIYTGRTICRRFLPNLDKFGTKSYSGRKIGLHSYFIELPAWYLIGTLAMTWTVYLSAYIVSKTNPGTRHPLMAANSIAFSVFGLINAVAFVKERIRKNVKEKQKLTIFEIVFLVFVVIFISNMMFKTFFVKDEMICIGFSVHSDFAPHMGMIRSFSYGNNFPTGYAHFAGEDIRYHFLFQFMVGNLEYLGMRLDYAFNIPSIISMVCVCSLLYTLAVRIIGKRLGGYLSVLFFLFRSSPSFFTYLASISEKENLSKVLKEQTNFISYTEHEDWGLWNLNVYCNQRHFAFSLAILILAIALYMPYVYRMAAKLKAFAQEKKALLAQENVEKPQSIFREFLNVFILNKEAMLPRNIGFALVTGLFLGGIAFWNGAVLIGCLSVLFVMALASDHRLDYLITAIIALTLSLLQSSFFVNGSAVSLKYCFGFLATNKTMWGAGKYLMDLWGILLILIVVYLFFGKGVKRYLVFAFSAPLILAFTLSMTVDVTVNHKFVMMSAMLLGIIVAEILTNLWEQKRFSLRFFAIIVAVCMTVTGIFDFIVVLRKNENQVRFLEKDPLTEWVKDNSDSKDIFLTSYVSLNKIVMGGGMLYYGWPYYAWSAGYNTWLREEKVKEMYEATSPQELQHMVLENNIRYIVVDRDVRENTNYEVNEANIAATYERVYTENPDEGVFAVNIYDTTLKLE